MSEETKSDREDLGEILAKTGKQVSITTTGPMRQVLIHALNVFEDANTPGEALRRALSNWFHAQKRDSKRGALARLEEGNARLLDGTEQLLANSEQLRAMVKDLSERNESIQREVTELQNQLSSRSE